MGKKARGTFLCPDDPVPAARDLFYILKDLRQRPPISPPPFFGFGLKSDSRLPILENRSSRTALCSNGRRIDDDVAIST